MFENTLIYKIRQAPMDLYQSASCQFTQMIIIKNCKPPRPQKHQHHPQPRGESIPIKMAAAFNASLRVSRQQEAAAAAKDPCVQLANKPKTILRKHPLYTPTNANLSLQFKEKILCLEIMGIDAGKALSLNPCLHAATLHSIQNIITFLQSKGIHQKDLPRIFGMCPKVLTADIKDDLIPVFDFLSRDLKVPENSYRKVINKCPRLLVSSVKDQLKPASFYLQRLGFRDMQALAYQDCVLLVSSVEKTLIPKLDFLVSLGFSKNDAIGMVLRCPGLFTFSLENNYKPKFEYFNREMGRELDELKEFPQYFAFSLEKRIKPRHSLAVECGVKIPLSLLLKTTDEEFEELLARQKAEV